jgi:energy-coupling factor transport system permease protein
VQSSTTGGTLLFVPGSSLLHRANPLTKLAGLVWVVSAATVLPGPADALLILGGTACAFATGIGPGVLKRLVITLTPLALALCIVHGLLIPRPGAIAVGPLTVSLAGLAFGITILLRVAAILTGSLILVLTTHSGDLLKALDASGAPPAVSYLIASPLLLLEPLMARAGDIRDAQRARGLDLNGSWKARVIALPMLLIPLVALALTDLDHRVLVLNGRAFQSGRRRTVIDPPPDDAAQRRFRWIALVVAVLQFGLLVHWR